MCPTGQAGPLSSRIELVGVADWLISFIFYYQAPFPLGLLVGETD